MAKHILLVDDDALMRRSLAFNLEQAGFHASTAASAEDALALARQNPPDLVLLDIGLPGMDGLDAIRQFKEQFKVPAIFVTARRRNLDEVLGLELGADDYITKPFSPRELAARVRAVLRRLPDEALERGPQEVTVGDLAVNFLRHEALFLGRPLELTPVEFKLLGVFAREPGRTFSRAQLIEKVLGYDFDGFDRTIDVHILNLRRKLEPDPSRPQLIKTVYGAGYKLTGDDVHA